MSKQEKCECTKHIHEDKTMKPKNQNKHEIPFYKNMIYHILMHESSILGHTIYNQTHNWVHKRIWACKACNSKIIHV